MKTSASFFCSSILLLSGAVHASDKDITLNSIAPYYDLKIIPSNISSECKELGAQMAAATKVNLERDGWSVILTDESSIKNEGAQIKLIIMNAMSSGNAFMGHQKSVSINAELYREGKLVDTYVGTRGSGGGFGAGFKGSCQVLERCVTTLGKDVAKWLKTKS